MWRDVIDGYYLRRGAIPVDATEPPPIVVDEILRSVEAAA